MRELVDNKKAQVEALGDKGRRTQDMIKKITNCYDYSLQSASHDVSAMQRAPLGYFVHSCGQDDTRRPDRTFCLEGPNSWCSYNRALAYGEQPRGHKKALLDFVRKTLEPVFAMPGNKDLLERCSDGEIQNRSESLHAIMWEQTSKSTHTSLFSV